MVSDKADTPLKKRFGQKLKGYCTRLGLTQQEAADLAKVNREYIGSMEIGASGLFTLMYSIASSVCTVSPDGNFSRSLVTRLTAQ